MKQPKTIIELQAALKDAMERCFPACNGGYILSTGDAVGQTRLLFPWHIPVQYRGGYCPPIQHAICAVDKFYDRVKHTQIARSKVWLEGCDQPWRQMTLIHKF